MYVEIGQVHHVIGSSEASDWKGCSSGCLQQRVCLIR
jgi:hypothetical protein